MDNAVQAILRENIRDMLENLHIYRNPSTRFQMNTWSGRCTLTPLALAMEYPQYHFQLVLNALVQEAGINPSEPYEILDHKKGIRIRTNALTHMLARWNPEKNDVCREGVLLALILEGADATAPALYEASPLLHDGGELPPYERALTAASGQSLMAFQMANSLQERTSFNLPSDLIERGHARFLPADPPGLFVMHLQKSDHTPSAIEGVMMWLCPPEGWLSFMKIAGGMLQPGEVASGELRRIVQGFDPDSGMNLLHMYVAYGSNHDASVIREQLCMLRDVYGLNWLTPTKDGRSLATLAKNSTAPFAQQMHAVVLELIEYEQTYSMAAAQALHNLPSLAVKEIGDRIPLRSLLHARGIYQQIIDARRRQEESSSMPYIKSTQL